MRRSADILSFVSLLAAMLALSVTQFAFPPVGFEGMIAVAGLPTWLIILCGVLTLSFALSCSQVALALSRGGPHLLRPPVFFVLAVDELAEVTLDRSRWHRGRAVFQNVREKSLRKAKGNALLEAHSASRKAAARPCITSVVSRLPSTQTRRTGSFRTQLGWLENQELVTVKSHASLLANKRFEYARTVRPTRNGEAPLLAAQPRR